ncbi:hypothetical protein BB560_007334 [Smittium megazygosporum]|uniref:Uncharacterized protein n=1 Tax=Smittium megazygosporum TaxID=133381 RepID=A0A2T9XWM8_9FUNG|nr:hypothetical protein BB560_007334 [Smittium megazygosporum]
MDQDPKEKKDSTDEKIESSSGPEKLNPYAGLSSFMENVSLTFSNLQRVITENERRLESVVSAMNSMMESTLLLGLESKILVESVDSKDFSSDLEYNSINKIDITIKNNTKFPVLGANLHFEFVLGKPVLQLLKNTNAGDGIFEVVDSSPSSDHRSIDGNSESQELENDKSIAISTPKGIEIPPLGAFKSSFLVGIRKRTRLECVFTLSFPNPGTPSKSLVLKNKFFLYLIYQFFRSFQAQVSEKDEFKVVSNSSPFCVKINTIRNLFRVPHSDSVQPGSICWLSSPSLVIGLRIDKISSSFDSASCSWIHPDTKKDNRRSSLSDSDLLLVLETCSKEILSSL